MGKQTNIREIANQANILLDTKPTFSEDGSVVYHPFFARCEAYCKPTKAQINKIREMHEHLSKPVGYHGVAVMVDIREGNNINKAREYIRDAISHIKNYSEFFFIINKPYYPLFFSKTEKYLSTKDFGESLTYLWKNVEFPNIDSEVSTDQFVKYFRQAKKSYLMDEEDLEIYNNLPDEVIIYRGINEYGNVEALSWTLDEEQAKWFATRWDQFGCEGTVYKAKIRKTDILACFDSEQEVVIDYTKIYELEKVE